ncbi:porin (plasmid) [Diaphorobacter sp. HDW4B]|uniref:porin n=1 Tax=Diaphorobacter sp. HDW4B TaxID=2714925 RepID=UPI001409B13E|nr:porin [Diaphorobacter sp. HDW4B]QIL73968.1 porin [Diaphorobacter sp. HDW4B]
MSRSKFVFTILAAASFTAAAQSKVEIYGVVDLGITKGNGGTANNAGANGTSDAWQVKQASASRVGFRGVEDLGGGLTAQFQLEHRFNPDTGDYNTKQPFFMQSTVGLSHKDIGTLWMGRDFIPAFWVAIKSDPFGMDGVGQVGPANLYADFASSSENASRTNNTVGFKSKRINGFSFDLAYGMHEQLTSAQSGFNVQYQAERLYAGLGYAKKNNAVAATAAVNDEFLNVAVHYNFDVLRLIGYVAQAKNKNFNYDSMEYLLALDAPVGPGRVKAAYTKVRGDYKLNDREKLGLGYDYNLSKQTRLYADVGVGRQKDKSTNTTFSVGIRKAF